MNRVGSHIPDAAKLGIAAPERPQIGNVPVDQHGIDILKAYGYTGCQQIDPDKPEAHEPELQSHFQMKRAKRKAKRKERREVRKSKKVQVRVVDEDEQENEE